MRNKTIEAGIALSLTAIVLASCIGPSKVEAAESDTSVLLGGWSSHLVTGDEYDYNETHNIVAVEIDNVLVGRFDNSFGRESYVLAYGWSKSWTSLNLTGSVHVGAVRGYKGCMGQNTGNTSICPIAIPALAYTKYAVQPALLLMGEAAVLAVKVAW